MTLKYWISDCLNDSPVYSIRAETKRACVAKRQERGYEGAELDRNFGPARKVEVSYDSNFDLMEKCSEEDHHYWEHIQTNKGV